MRARKSGFARGLAALLALAALAVGRPAPVHAAAGPADLATVREWVGVLGEVAALRPGDVVTLVQQLRAVHQQPVVPGGTSSGKPSGRAAGVPALDIPQAGADGPTVDLGDLSDPAALDRKLRPLTRLPAAAVRVTVPGGRARLGDFGLATGQELQGNLLVVRGNADVYGTLRGNLVTVNGDVIVHPGAVVAGDVLALHGEVRDLGGEIAGDIRTLDGGPAATARAARPAPVLSPAAQVGRNVAGVVGVFLTLGALGFGFVLFGRPNLETVSDTVIHSFGRSFVTGLVGQLLLVPTFGMLVVGLILSVVGVLLLPFAVAIYALLVIVAVVGGYLAVAHAVGETYTRRRLASGAFAGSPNSYRYLTVGLGGLFLVWTAWAIFGWVPVAGTLIGTAALLVTWLLGTAGFGAALLSRAGVKPQFAGRLVPPEALTDEYLWATPQFGVPAVKRPPRPPQTGA